MTPELIEQMDHITLNDNQLLLSVNDFFNSYEKKEPLQMFWASPDFISASTRASREAIVLAMLAISLDGGVNFKDYLDNGFDKKAQKDDTLKIESWLKKNSLNSDTWASELTAFWNALRRELFSYLYSSNKELRHITKISSKVLDSRYELFMDCFK